jgi:hypothetical protein
VLDDIVRIDDEGGAQGDAVFLVQDAQFASELAAGVGELPDRQLVQVRVVAAPGQLDEFVIGRAAEDDSVAILEILAQLGEGGDFGRTDESKVLRIEEDDLPLAVKAVLRQRFKRGDAIFFMVVEARLHASDLEFRQFLTDAQHSGAPF